MGENRITEQESLSIISEMIAKAKGSFHETGASAILWGTITAFCGFTSFAMVQWKLDIGFDVWWLIFLAVIPQIYITSQEKKKRLVKTHQQEATSVVWLIFAISIGALMFYNNIVPVVSDKMMLNEGVQLLQKNTTTGEIANFNLFIPGVSSLYLIIYAIPTLATGLIHKFKPMVWGAIVCYALFFISLFTSFKYDMLLLGLAGIANWLIPGIILWNRYKKGKAC